MPRTYSRTDENCCVCNICGYDFAFNEKYDERPLHKHLATRPIDTSLVKGVVWQQGDNILFMADKYYTEELVTDMRRIANGIFNASHAPTFCALSLDNSIIYVLAKHTSKFRSMLVGYIAISEAVYNDKWPMVSQIFIMSKFQKCGYGSFLLLKGLELFGAKGCMFGDISNEFASMLSRLETRHYLKRIKHKFEILKKPTMRSLRVM